MGECLLLDGKGEIELKNKNDLCTMYTTTLIHKCCELHRVIELPSTFLPQTLLFAYTYLKVISGIYILAAGDKMKN